MSNKKFKHILDLEVTTGLPHGEFPIVILKNTEEGYYLWRGMGQIVPQGCTLYAVAEIHTNWEVAEDGEMFLDPVRVNFQEETDCRWWQRIAKGDGWVESGEIDFAYSSDGMPFAAQFCHPTKVAN